MQEKILVGHKLRRFRQSSGLSQTAMAEALDISPSYLNLLEHNQLPSHASGTTSSVGADAPCQRVAAGDRS